jgi:hypothetical protein
MKYLKLFEEFVSSVSDVKFKKGEFEVKEIFRIFTKFQDKLPKEIDKSIFDETKLNSGEPIEFERHIDPKFQKDQYTTEELLKLKEFTIEDEKGAKIKVSPEKYRSFIVWAQSLFNKGTLTPTTRKDVEKIAKDSNSINRGDFSEFLKDANLIKKLQASYDKATGELSKHGLDIYQTGLFDKFPQLKDDIMKASQYDYYANTWKVLDSQLKKGEISASSVLEIDNKLYLVGGNRRMAFFIAIGINPNIWKMKL